MKQDADHRIEAAPDRPRSRGGEGASQRGYTLTEALVVLALIGLMVLFGGPALASAYKSYKVRSAADGLTTSLRALRYTAVAERAPKTMTINDQNAMPPNQYSYVNMKGQPVVVTHDGVLIESGSPSSITFDINGATGLTSNQNILVSMNVSSTRGERYTITVTPTGTVTASFSTYTP